MQTTSRPGPVRRSSPNGNQAISAELLAKFMGLIEAVSFKMGMTYSLAKEDREDLVAQVTMKIFSVDWCRLRVESNGRSPEDYCRSLILNSMRKEVRRIKTGGFRGLGTMEVGEIPAPYDVEFHDGHRSRPADTGEGRRTNHDRQIEPSTTQCQEELQAASEIARCAAKVLTPAQFMVIEALFGFDGGGERTIEQAAKELGISRREASELSITAIEALRAHLKVRSVSFS